MFSDQEVQNLRTYLISGGFLHIDDNYGLDPFIRPQMKKVFPELDFVELPTNHPIYHQKFDFPNGLPKIHGTLVKFLMNIQDEIITVLIINSEDDSQLMKLKIEKHVRIWNLMIWVNLGKQSHIA